MLNLGRSCNIPFVFHRDGCNGILVDEFGLGELVAFNNNILLSLSVVDTGI